MLRLLLWFSAAIGAFTVIIGFAFLALMLDAARIDHQRYNELRRRKGLMAKSPQGDKHRAAADKHDAASRSHRAAADRHDAGQHDQGMDHSEQAASHAEQAKTATDDAKQASQGST